MSKLYHYEGVFALEEFRGNNIQLLPKEHKKDCLNILRKEREKAVQYRYDTSEPLYKAKTLQYGEFLMFGCLNNKKDYIAKAVAEIVKAVYDSGKNGNNNEHFVENCYAWLEELCQFYMVDENAINAVLGKNIKDIVMEYMGTVNTDESMTKNKSVVKPSIKKTNFGTVPCKEYNQNCIVKAVAKNKFVYQL